MTSRSRASGTVSVIGASIVPSRPNVRPGGPEIFVAWRPTLVSRRTMSTEKSFPSRGAKKGSEV